MSDTRPTFHFTPPVNWLNDPNGLVYFDGEYHLFYQHHPHSMVWGPMHWGHAVSADLVNWRHLPIALFPDSFGMIFSGSAVVDWTNAAGFGEKALVAIFTYNKDYRETQNLAYSLDRGRTWTKYAGNPVIPAPQPLSDCRDPKVFWHKDHWVMLLAAKDKILFLTSTDLKDWNQSGIFGGGYGSTSGVWETPDLFELRVDDGAETRWVLTVGVGDGAPAGGSGTQYFIGQFDGQRFIPDESRDTVRWADFGADFYAAQSWNEEPNGRRLIVGWMSNWQYAAHAPTSGWRGSLSLIRELSLTRSAGEICLVQKPLPELQSLRQNHLQLWKLMMQPRENLLAGVEATALEIHTVFEVTEETDSFGFRVRVGQNEFAEIRYSAHEKELTVDRTRAGCVNFKAGFARAHCADLMPVDGHIRLHIFVDAFSIEVFANDGLVVFSESIFPAAQSKRIELFAQGGNVFLRSLDLYQIKPARFEN
jgi:fructan beta-fructosidase